MKRIIKTLINRAIDALNSLTFTTSLGRYCMGRLLASAMNRTQSVTHRNLSLTFAVPNPLNKFRADSFSTKEPETLEWIDGIPQNSILWDIGANVGLYTCYACKARGCRVIAFEPSVFNLELLARNIFLNGLTNQSIIVPLPLSEALALSKLNMTSMEWGGAMSAFGVSYGHDGLTMHKIFEVPTVGISAAEAVRLLNLPKPDYIKIDVDGIEHLILEGAVPILNGVKSILVEINDAFAEQANTAATYLKESGFSLVEKKHADYFDEPSSSGRHTFNQIWVRRPQVA